MVSLLVEASVRIYPEHANVKWSNYNFGGERSTDACRKEGGTTTMRAASATVLLSVSACLLTLDTEQPAQPQQPPVKRADAEPGKAGPSLVIEQSESHSFLAGAAGRSELRSWSFRTQGAK